MLKRIETVLFLLAVTAALALPALPFLQELRAAEAQRQAALTPIMLERVVVRAPGSSSSQQIVLAR